LLALFSTWVAVFGFNLSFTFQWIITSIRVLTPLHLLPKKDQVQIRCLKLAADMLSMLKLRLGLPGLDASFFSGNHFYAHMQWGGIYCAITLQILKMLYKNDKNPP
jgi:hypothetical protein